MSRDAGKLARLEPEQRKLYDLIWKRTIASQMAAAKLERTTVDIQSKDGQVALRATGQVIVFDGFLKVYSEGRDDVEYSTIDPGTDTETDDSRRLPVIHEGDAAALREGGLAAAFDKISGDADEVLDDGAAGDMRRTKGAVLAGKDAVLGQQHFTQPPPRYTEATLVKRMEELGIGRPSTYASIVTTIQDREYVRKDKGRLIPEDKGRLVTAFLENYFRKYVGYDFTANLEEELDDVSGGRADWKELLGRFWRDFSGAIDETRELRITEVLEKINEILAPHLFPAKADGSDPRLCPNCGEGRLSMRTARSGGAFIGCSKYPECRYTRPLSGETEDGDHAGPDGKLLGHNDDGVAVTLRSGRFGPYVQLGEQKEGSTEKPKRASIPKTLPLDALELKKALDLLSLPRLIGPHPEDGEPVETAIGRYGPYVKHGRIYANLSDAEEVFTIGMNRAVELIAQKAANGRGAVAAKPLKELGDHPDGGPIAVMSGRYGPYVKWAKVNATLPKEMAPEAVTMEDALALIAEKQGKKKPSKKAAAKAPKKAVKKAAKKVTAKK
jgi:DNA topoisomerase-1